MSRITALVSKPQREYDIVLASGLFERPESFKSHMSADRALIVTTPTVHALYGGFIAALSKQFAQSSLAVIRCSESSKNLETLSHLCELAQHQRLGRKDVFVAVAGGCCTDVVTTAAALYRRGVGTIRVPTTLIGAIDASVGIKSSLNLFQNKSALGTYHAPRSVLVDLAFLGSLPSVHVRCGVAEIVKMALVTDAALFSDLSAHAPRLVEPSFYASYDPAAKRIVARSIERMVEQLQSNFFEDVTYERLVDFGHTFSNVWEPASDWQIPHGLAVALDMALSCCISNSRGMLCDADLERVLGLLLQAELPLFDPVMTLESCLVALEKARLHRGGDINLVIPDEIGSGTFIRDCSRDLEREIEQGLELLARMQAGRDQAATKRSDVLPGGLESPRSSRERRLQ